MLISVIFFIFVRKMIIGHQILCFCIGNYETCLIYKDSV
ncbi:Uncharacterized protein dnm_020910 [Desulfonema magnum]|uniref:Uncharacterized protein n=1 Tax=Desulfonema magnum TaxID=45655 RepID=A0A975BIP8_9BACT|nr:Uncharacterized protein dnm_020910 [Desulfonema magnum]